jgi:hypothetical protein
MMEFLKLKRFSGALYYTPKQNEKECSVKIAKSHFKLNIQKTIISQVKCLKLNRPKSLPSSILYPHHIPLLEYLTGTFTLDLS